MADSTGLVYVWLRKDEKIISRTRYMGPTPTTVPHTWNISTKFLKINEIPPELPQCSLVHDYETDYQKNEWGIFMNFLWNSQKVAFVETDCCQFYIHPPSEVTEFKCADVRYLMKNTLNMSSSQMQIESGIMDAKNAIGPAPPPTDSVNSGSVKRVRSPTGEFAENSGRMTRNQSFPHHKPEVNTDDRGTAALVSETYRQAEIYSKVVNDQPEKNHARLYPSYLKNLGRVHSGWIFGAIAELVENARDAKAKQLSISMDTKFSKSLGKTYTMLSLRDDGIGMTHEQILRMVAFGHEQPDTIDPDHTVKFGVGFKTAAMALGKDVLVFTQATDTRSVAFLSQSLNEGKNNIEIPVVTYCKDSLDMNFDTSVQSEATSKANLKAIMDYSPFTTYSIGAIFSLFKEDGTGTLICIWNLIEWKSNDGLDLEAGLTGGSSFHQGDIIIRSQRHRSRPSQMALKVPVDFSLRSYLEVIFIDPRMKIFVQGSQVKSRPLGKFLSNTMVVNDNIMGKAVQVTIGLSQLEWEQKNCGMFLYWHGRLIEAYKRVGSMVHNADKNHGIIGVIDVTDLMNEGNGHAWIHDNKQGFIDCEVYAVLEQWLGKIVDEYMDKSLDKSLPEKGVFLYKPDYEWVQCDDCRKWRKLTPAFDSKNLPSEWFCRMSPFCKPCDTPEDIVEAVYSVRFRDDMKETSASKISLLGEASCSSKGRNEDASQIGKDKSSMEPGWLEE